MNQAMRRFIVVWETGATIRYYVEDTNTGIFVAGPFRLKAKAQQKANLLENRSKKNPLPVGRLVKVRAIRRKNGRVDLYRA
jgi:hypothetical protein